MVNKKTTTKPKEAEKEAKAQKQEQKEARQQFRVLTSLQAGQQIVYIPITQLVESQVAPREEKKGIAQLKKSIKNLGILEPLVIRPLPEDTTGKFEVISGNRRLEAAKELNLQTLPCLVKPVEGAAAMSHAFVSNTQRVALSKPDKVFMVSELVAMVGNAEAAILLCLTPKQIEKLVEAETKEPEAVATEAPKETTLLLDMQQTLAFVQGERSKATFTKRLAEAGTAFTLVGVLGRGKVTAVNDVEGGVELQWELITG